MPDLFGLDIAGILNDAMGDGLLPAILTRFTTGQRIAGQMTAGRVRTPTSYNARGFVEMYRESQVDGEVIQAGDRKIGLLGASIEGGTVPEPGMVVFIESRYFEIVGPGVDRDPAAALYICHGRPTAAPA